MIDETEKKLYKELNEAAIKVYHFDNQMILGSIINTMISNEVDVEQLETLNLFKTEWDKFQDELLETISEFEKKDQENVKLFSELSTAKIELEKALHSSEKEKMEVSNQLELMQATVRTSLMSTVVKIGLLMICGIIFLVSGLYIVEIYKGEEQGKLIMANLLSTIFVSVVSSAFSVIATVLGLRQSGAGNNNSTNTTTNN